MSIFTKASAVIDRSVIRFMERQMAPRASKIDPDARTLLISLAADYGRDARATKTSDARIRSSPSPTLTLTGT